MGEIWSEFVNILKKNHDVIKSFDYISKTDLVQLPFPPPEKFPSRSQVNFN